MSRTGPRWLPRSNLASHKPFRRKNVLSTPRPLKAALRNKRESGVVGGADNALALASKS